MNKTIYLATWIQEGEVEAYREDVRAITQDSSNADLLGPDCQVAMTSMGTEETDQIQKRAKASFVEDWSQQEDEEFEQIVREFETASWTLAHAEQWLGIEGHKTQTWGLRGVHGEPMGWLFIKQQKMGLA